MEKIIYVNSNKEQRAKDILALFTKQTLTDDEIETKRKFENFLADVKMTFTDEEALKFVYEKLGGLVRTVAEQKVADKKKEEIQKKRKVDLDNHEKR